MKPQFANQLVSSFLLWFDNYVLTQGEAFVNTSSLLYPSNTSYNGYYTYSSPYGQFVSDHSISGATIMTGVYVNDVFVTKGQSGLIDIDYYNGRAYFNQNVPGTVSGAYAIKDFNTILTDDPEKVILFETKYSPRPRSTRQVTGLISNQLPYPLIFCKLNGGNSVPMAFGGLDNTVHTIRTIVLSDSIFKLDALASIIVDGARRHIPIILSEEMPFNILGGYNSSQYNYTGLVAGKVPSGTSAFIPRSYVMKYNQGVVGDLKMANPETYAMIADFEIETYRYPRI